MRDGIISTTHGKATSVRNYEFPNESWKVYFSFLQHGLTDKWKLNSYYEWQRQSVSDNQTANLEKENQSMDSNNSEKPYLYQ